MKTDNELIAEFMELPFSDQISDHIGKHGVMVKGMQYHASWDWLMPVVEKIENIKHIGIDVVYIQINGRQCQIWTYFDVKEFLRLTGDDNNDSNKFKVGHSAKTKIDATYHAVVDFIKWYNSQKK